jgi:hypothetical protein
MRVPPVCSPGIMITVRCTRCTAIHAWRCVSSSSSSLIQGVGMISDPGECGRRAAERRLPLRLVLVVRLLLRCPVGKWGGA